jgi:hypothetical protein
MKVRPIQLVIGLACTMFFLAIAFYRVQLGAVSAALARADPLWAAAAMLIYAVNLALRAWRWQVILGPVAAIPYPIVARALLVGYGLNAVMPARLGELFRAEFFKKTYGLSRVWGLTSIVIERLSFVRRPDWSEVVWERDQTRAAWKVIVYGALPG